MLPEKEYRYWAVSVDEHLMKANIRVMHHGEPMPIEDQPVHRFLQLTASESKGLWPRVVRAKRDLVGYTRSMATWCIPPAMSWL